MRKTFFGAALFFCGLGMILTLFCPFDGWIWRLIAGMIFMIIGIKLGGSC